MEKTARKLWGLLEVLTLAQTGRIESMEEKRRLRGGTPDGYHADKRTAGSGADIGVVQRARAFARSCSI